MQLNRSSQGHFIRAVGDTTDDEGKFTFSNLPADQGYVIFTVVGDGPRESVLTTKRFLALGNGAERDLGALEAIAALRLAGRVELPDGQALPSGVKIVLGRNPAWDLISVAVGADGRFEIRGLPPESYVVGIAGDGLSIDAPRLTYQMLGETSFGLRLNQSIGDLRIPIQSRQENQGQKNYASSAEFVGEFLLG